MHQFRWQNLLKVSKTNKKLLKNKFVIFQIFEIHNFTSSKCFCQTKWLPNFIVTIDTISHNSPTYGSPFNMLNNFRIAYNTAGENIAGNSSNSAAVTAWMNSSGHRANILNSSFNYTGIGVVNGSKYGKIYVQMFIGK